MDGNFGFLAREASFRLERPLGIDQALIKVKMGNREGGCAWAHLCLVSEPDCYGLRLFRTHVSVPLAFQGSIPLRSSTARMRPSFTFQRTVEHR